ncbi:MAG: hypothetical protein Q4E38_03105, partial [Eubacteriales bacterium]|nr:hypothetical protein [Eubacteriales bacterium]
VISDFKEPFSGAYLHKLFLHCSIFKVHSQAPRLSAAAYLCYHRGFRLSREIFHFSKISFSLSDSCVALSQALG